MPDLSNVQNLAANGYKRPLSRHRVFEFPSGSSPREFVRSLLAFVPSAAVWDNRPANVLHFAFSAEGLRRIGPEVLSEAALETFSVPFKNTPDRDALRDAGMEYWAGVSTSAMQCLVATWSDTEVHDSQMAQEVTTSAARYGLVERFVTKDGAQVQGALLDGNTARLHFGYRDAISKPQVTWDADVEPPGCVNFRRIVVGYGTEEIPSSPNVFSAQTETRQEAVRFAQDGSYLAFTLIEQDVATFNRYLEEQAKQLLGPVADAAEVEEKVQWLAAKFLGRWRNGKPLAHAPIDSNAAVPEEHLNDFDFSDDHQGMKCPLAAHIRVVNPRSQPVDALSAPVPVVIRRGMPFGTELKGTTDDGKSRGLIGLFICADLNAQFVKLVQWINKTNFSSAFADRLLDEDPVAGNRHYERASMEFRIPMPDKDIILKGLPQFTTTLGTAYFFLPSMAALRKIAGVGEVPAQI